jgi:hypothetical protein
MDEQPTIKELVAAEKLASAEMVRLMEGLGSDKSTLAEAEEAVRARGRAGYELACAKGRLETETTTEKLIQELRARYAAMIADKERGGYVKGWG